MINSRVRVGEPVLRKTVILLRAEKFSGNIGRGA